MNKWPAAQKVNRRPRAAAKHTIKKPAAASSLTRSQARLFNKQKASYATIANAASSADAGAKSIVRLPLRHGKRGSACEEPLFAKEEWKWLPQWVALYAERGSCPRCWDGHRLTTVVQDKATTSCCVWCEQPPPAGECILKCRRCPHWVVCARCEHRPRLPALEVDPLFHGPRDPCLLHSAQTAESVPAASRGAVIICPGGNYEFLCPQEGPPVAEWLAQHGIRAFVLRYRLLPAHSFEDMLSDLSAAIPLARHAAHGGPVAAIGFSAGGHLVAAFNCQAHPCSTKKEQRRPVLDAQVLVYPCIDSSDWADPDSCGFFDFEKSFPAAQSLHACREAMLGGPGFWAPPSLLVASTADEASPPKEHTDRYARALKSSNIPCKYLKRDFGPHGFGLEGGWTGAAVAWLRSQGFGVPSKGCGVKRLSATSAVAVAGG